jgi:predicted metal-dependent hydrolase
MGTKPDGARLRMRKRGQNKGMIKKKESVRNEILIGDIKIEIERKKIKNLHLRVYPPDGRVKVSAPLRFSEDMIREFAVSKIDWIRRNRDRIRKRDPQLPCKYTDGESHFYNGRCYRLELIEQETKPHVEIEGGTIRLYVRPGADLDKRKAVMYEFYRDRLKQVLPGIVVRWEKEMGVRVREFRVKSMKTKWGTCNRKAQRIWINLELAKKPPECLEYIVVHEMVHLLERYHNDTFYRYMDRFLPQWRTYKDVLNK